MLKLKGVWKWAAIGLTVIFLAGAVTFINAWISDSAVGAPPVYGRTITEALDKGGRNVALILAQEKIARGVLVFYLPRIGGDRAGVQSELGVEYLQQTLRGWKMSFQGGAYSSGIEQKLYGEFLPDDGDQATPLPLFYGEVKDPGIKYVSVTDVQKGEEKQAKVIVAGQKPGLSVDRRIWYAALGQPGGDTYEIRGRGDNDQVLFAETVNVRQGSYSGTVPRAEVNAGSWQTYTSAAYNLTLQYPAVWKKDSHYGERYSGSDGFFALAAASGVGRTIDQMADGEAHHKLRPYGSNPQIRKVEVSGQEGRLILPATDQPPEMANQAVMIVQSPASIRVGGDSYRYLSTLGTFLGAFASRFPTGRKQPARRPSS